MMTPDEIQQLRDLIAEGDELARQGYDTEMMNSMNRVLLERALSGNYVRWSDEGS